MARMEGGVVREETEPGSNRSCRSHLLLSFAGRRRFGERRPGREGRRSVPGQRPRRRRRLGHLPVSVRVRRGRGVRPGRACLDVADDARLRDRAVPRVQHAARSGERPARRQRPVRQPRRGASAQRTVRAAGGCRSGPDAGESGRPAIRGERGNGRDVGPAGDTARRPTVRRRRRLAPESPVVRCRANRDRRAAARPLQLRPGAQRPPHHRRGRSADRPPSARVVRNP